MRWPSDLGSARARAQSGVIRAPDSSLFPKPITPGGNKPPSVIQPGQATPPAVAPLIPSAPATNPQTIQQPAATLETINPEDIKEMLFPQKRAAWDNEAPLAPAKLLEQKWPIADGAATIQLSDNAVNSGTRRLTATLKLENKSDKPQRILLTGLRFSLAGKNQSASFFALPLASLPLILAPQGHAEQAFRVDTFNDTPPGSYAVEPLALCIAQADELLQNGGFEPGAADGWISNSTGKAARVKSVAPLAELSNTVFDWSDFSKLPFANSKHFATQGDGLLEAEATENRSVAEQSIKHLKAGERYVAGADSWGNARLRVELQNEKGESLNFAERTQGAANWRGSVIRFVALQTATAKVSLRASGKTWWDNVFFVPESALHSASSTPATLTISDNTKARSGDVVYLGDDRETQGDWTGKYGNYAFILSAMSAPRDMVTRPIRVTAMIATTKIIGGRKLTRMPFENWS